MAGKLTPVTMATSLSSLPMLPVRMVDVGTRVSCRSKRGVYQSNGGLLHTPLDWTGVFGGFTLLENAGLSQSLPTPRSSASSARSQEMEASNRRTRLVGEHLQPRQDDTAQGTMHLCDFHELPPVEGQAAGCAWNYYAPDKTQRDQLGRRSERICLGYIRTIRNWKACPYMCCVQA